MEAILGPIAGAGASALFGGLFGGGEEAPSYGQAEDPATAALRNLLMRELQQGLSTGGIPPEVEQQMFQRAQERLADPFAEQMERLQSYMQSQGLAGSTPALESMSKAEKGYGQSLQDVSRDIAIENAMRRRDYISQALQMFGTVKGGQPAAYEAAYKPWAARQQAVGNLAGRLGGGIGQGIGNWAGSWGQPQALPALGAARTQAQGAGW